MADSGQPLSDPTQYRRLVGKLICLTITRPDITYVVQLLSQFMASPTVEHMQIANHVLRYLKSCLGHGIFLATDSSTHLTTYCDSDWTSCPIGRRSTTGYAVILGQSLISWHIKKQDIISCSSAEAEYHAMEMTTCEITWLLALLFDLGFTKQQLLPVELLCDNMATLHIARNPVFHKRSKHIEVDCHYVHDKITAGILKTAHVSTMFQLADVFTNAIPVDQFSELLSKLGVVDFFRSTHPT